MTSWSRAFYGALLGAVITLFVHPSSRPFVAGPFVESSTFIENRSFQLPSSYPEVLPHPVDDLSASLWIHVGAEQIRNRTGLSARQIEGLVKIATIRSAADPTNAFWPLSAAVLENEAGHLDKSMAYWKKAATCLLYNDYQSRYLSKVRDEIASIVSPNSWQYAYCYRLRSTALAFLIESLARKFVSRAGRTNSPDLEIRYQTLINGGLLRDGSRHLEIMERGLSIVEVASHPKELQREPSIKRLLLAHTEFKEALRRLGWNQQAEAVDKAYNENDGWRALTRREDTDEKLANLTLFSALWPNLPGVLLQCGIVAAIVGLFGIGLESLAKRSPRHAAVLTGLFATSVSITVFMLTKSWLALLACGLCCAFVILTPRNPRHHMPKDLGPLFGFVVAVLSFVFVAVLGVMLLTRTLPVQASSAAFDAHFTSVSDPAMMAGLALIILSCVFLFAPLWALAQHIRTLFVLSRGFQSLGVVAATFSLLLSVAVTPVSIHFEADNQNTFRMLMENEPVYYVGQ